MTQVATQAGPVNAEPQRQDDVAPERGVRGRVALALLVPMLGVFAVGFLVPLGTVARFSFNDYEPGVGQTSAWTVSQYSAVFSSPTDSGAILRTFELGLITAVISALLSYPLALAITRGPRWARTPLTAMVMMPLLVSVVVKTFGWQILLSSEAFPQKTLDALGIPVKLLFTQTGVSIGLVHTYMPFMALSLITALAAIDRRTEEAAASLGSSRWRVFWTITFPQSINGLIAGFVLTFAASMSALVTPQLLGGGRVPTVVTSIFRQVETVQNYPYGAALGILLLAATLALLFVQSAVLGRRERG
ncbi:ABC transporter permease [Nocardioides sp. GXZ039]|uniref:ABC transporter permease n=1 Tax=Nocardioides sp. GXZ039 TaxID=3136018 RepID=UPI0030F3FD5E